MLTKKSKITLSSVFCFSLFSMLLFFSCDANSQEVTPKPKPTGVEAGTKDLKIKDKKQTYPGGVDEEDIVVQEQLVKPIRKVQLPKLNQSTEQSGDD